MTMISVVVKLAHRLLLGFLATAPLPVVPGKSMNGSMQAVADHVEVAEMEDSPA